MKSSVSNKIIASLSSAAILASAMSIAVPAAAIADDSSVPLIGDANLDEHVSIADATAILQHLGNKDKYGLTGMALENADVYNRGDGVSVQDANTIQKFDALVITELPESWLEGYQPGSEDPQADVTYIHLSKTSATVEGDFAKVSGTTVTITHSGSFYIDGTLDDGQINVNIADETADPETVKIFLNGVNITGKSAPAILVTNAENTSVNLVDGTENFISDGDAAYSGDWLGAAVIEAKDDITFKGGDLGTGILNLTANTQDGIVCNNDIKVNGGIINITTLNSTDKTNGINGKSSLSVKDGTLTVDAEGDGIKSGKGSVAISGGNLSVKAGNDAVQSGTTIDISGGVLLAGGDRGLTSAAGTNISGGTVVATATDYQTDATLLTSSNQATILLNTIADSTSSDGTWKKANALTVAGVELDKWVKKYSFALISDPSIAAGQTYTITNASTGTAVTHSNDTADSFAVTDSVTIFGKVNPAGRDRSAV